MRERERWMKGRRVRMEEREDRRVRGEGGRERLESESLKSELI